MPRGRGRPGPTGWTLVAAAGLVLAIALAMRVDRSGFAPEVLAGRVRAAGPLGAAVLLGLLVFQCIVAPLPSEPLMMTAGYVYGSSQGFAFSLAGMTIRGAACFALSRRFGRPLAERMVRRERLDAIDAHLAGRRLPAILFGVLLGVPWVLRRSAAH